MGGLDNHPIQVTLHELVYINSLAGLTILIRAISLLSHKKLFLLLSLYDLGLELVCSCDHKYSRFLSPHCQVYGFVVVVEVYVNH